MAYKATTYIGLGGNVGDVLNNMRRALDIIDQRDDTSVLAISRLYKTPPWGIEDQDWFLNACAELATNLAPEKLLDLCLDTEISLKRIRAQKWGPRTIDLDVLDYNGLNINSERLELPHPRMADRAFVLMPLCDIAPDKVINGKTCKQLLSALEEPGIELEIDNQKWWSNKS